jgi:NAD+ diphosphatase
MDLTFTRSPLDHAGLFRGDPGWIDSLLADPSARVLALSGGAPLPGPDGAPLILTVAEAEAQARTLPPGLVFLGLEDGVPWFAAMLEGEALDFRRAAMTAPPGLAAILGRARSMLLWHGRRRFCSNCGAENAVRDGGARLVCPSCGMEHFPRTDPSVIMLVHRGGRAVLGRQPGWPDGMWSTLAGFMEPGETIEEACAREVFEETGLRVTAACYVASQPWPFPSTLMIGLIAEVAEGEPVARDDLEDARWFTRAETRALYEDVMARWAPPHFSVSRLLIETWLKM